MKHLRRGFTLFLTLGIFTACNDDPTELEPEPDEFEWAAALQGTVGWEQLTGQAEVVWVEGETQFEATASISGDESGSIRPWHVHHNTCAEGGSIVGADGDYPRLTVGENGAATASATVPLAMDTTASFHVNVHLSPAEMGTVIACGNLNRVAN
jgi:hypothetical protein